MMRLILKQLWNKRRANAWIMLELVLVTFFLWGVIDPVYVLLSNKSIDPGYDINNVFRLYIGQYPSTHSKYSEEMDSDSLRMVGLLRIYDRVRQHPGVESAVITENNGYPLSSSTSLWDLKRDTFVTSSLDMSFYHDGDFFRVFRIADVNTGIIPDHRNPTERTTYITKGVAKKLFPDSNVTGKQVFRGNPEDPDYHTVMGVMPDFKFHSTRQPWQTSFRPMRKIGVDGFPWAAQICFRIHDGLPGQVFAEQFKKEMASHVSVGNLYPMQLTSFDAIYWQSEFQLGVTNKLRLQTSLAVFFLICTFLGIAGTFWLRSDARRGEIGLRMALGGSRKNILKEFLMESWWLTTIAWLTGVFFVLQRVYLNGFAEPPQFQDDAYLQNRFVPHFLIVSAIVYVLMLAIAVLGTWIPARQAASVAPSEALRDE